MPSAHTPQTANAASAWSKFRRWRRARPFPGGLLLILSGVELFLSGNLDLGALQVHVGPTGFLSYVIPAMLVLCGGGTLATPHLRLFYGILGSLVAVYSLIGLNLGGFMLGLLFGIIGGALTIAWTPVSASAPAADASAADDELESPEPAALEPEVGPQPRYDDTVEIPRQADSPDRWWGGSEAGPRHNGSEVVGPRHDGSATGPRHSEEEPPPYGTTGGSHTRILAITLVPVTLAAALFTVVDKSVPAYAGPCPTRSATAASAAPKAASSKGAQAATPQKGPTGGPAAVPQNGQVAAPQGANASGTGEATPSASPSAAAETKPSGNLLADAWNGVVDGVNGLVGGVKKLFGAGQSTTPSDPAPSASATASPGPEPGGSASPSTPGALPGVSASPALPGAGKAQPRSSAAAATSPSCASISATAEANQPWVAVSPGKITAAVQNMTNFTYEGVTELPSVNGPIKALKFTMTQAVTEPFTLRVPERDGKTTQITSTKLTIRSKQTAVSFYTTSFTGTLTALGLPVIPIRIPLPPILRDTYTPDHEPPLPKQLTFTSAQFSDVIVDLAFVRSEVLTADAMHISEI